MKNTLKELQHAANILRGLSMDGVQKANSGHPGLPLGAADFAAILWTQFLKHNPKNPTWKNRDRFVLSGGHGSMLLYSLLHLTGYDVSKDDLKEFRQWGSKTPGHPELGDTPGVETTTGPLGQGIGNAVGMALAEVSLAARYNKPDHKVVDHFTYVVAGDGDLQEGVSHEVSAFAGHNQLGKLILLYDDNNITIDGRTELSFSEDVIKRYDGYGWQTQQVDGHDMEAVYAAIAEAKEITDKPSFIACKTIIGKGSPNKQDTSHVHGSPLGAEEIELTKRELGLPNEHFYVSKEAQDVFRVAIKEGNDKETEWDTLINSYKLNYPEIAEQFLNMDTLDVEDLEISPFETGQSMATRSASGTVLNQIASRIPSLLGGSADLTPSNNTFPKGEASFGTANPSGRYIHYGVRELGMGAIMNGLALHGGVLPYAGTFFVFSDYMRPAMRMAALIGLQVVYVLTHDSIGLGEDGPTHQPVAHLTSLRAIPNMTVFRPADANETIEGWKLALKNITGPTCLVLTRQGLPILEHDKVTGASKGGYVFTEDEGFDTIIIASGSELEIALEAKQVLNDKGEKVRIVSMPCTDIYEAQNTHYKESVLPNSCVNRVAVEAGSTMGWYKYVGLQGKVIGLDRFGASAPYKTLYQEFGITSENVVRAVMSLKETNNNLSSIPIDIGIA
jgi:transketolase